MDIKQLVANPRLYKPAQGMIARGTAGVILAFFAFFAAYSLFQWPANDSWWRVPRLFDLGDWSIVWGHPISALFFLVMIGAAYFFVVNHPRAADFLIETEAELRKVNWPAKHEYLGSSFVVVISVVVLGTFLFVADYVFSALMRNIGYL